MLRRVSSRSAPVVSNLVITANTLVFHTCYCYVKRVITKLWLGDHHLMVDSDVSLITCGYEIISCLSLSVVVTVTSRCD